SVPHVPGQFGEFTGIFTLANEGFCGLGAHDAFVERASDLAVELAPNVRVNAVCPGGMRSRMTEEMFADEELTRNAEGKYPSGFGKFMDIVPAVEFLLSDNARWLTGQSIVIDGGRTLNISDK
ncbi:MAG: SDR family oxidoreductase, partial [Synergistaceae bacterium]|nr:SDR family oxidoreductase [Synergistaceae bacterium]